MTHLTCVRPSDDSRDGVLSVTGVKGRVSVGPPLPADGAADGVQEDAD